MLLMLACSDAPVDSAAPPDEQPTERFQVTLENPAVAYPFAKGAGLDSDRVTFTAPIAHEVVVVCGYAGGLVTGKAPLYEGRERSMGDLVVEYWTAELEPLDFFEDPEALAGTLSEGGGEAGFHLELALDVEVTRGAWFVHHLEDPFADEDFRAALAKLAEGSDGDSVSWVEANSGLTSVFGPGVFVVHEPDQEPFFTLDEPDRGEGLEDLAEDGNPLPLGNALQDLGDFAFVSVYGPGDVAQGYSPIEPGGVSDFGVDVAEGQVVSVAFMFSQSNDAFLAATFDPFTAAAELTPEFLLHDAGTEANQEPGVGDDQGPRQVEADSGEADPDDTVRLLGDGFAYPTVPDFLRVTLQRVGDDTGG